MHRVGNVLVWASEIEDKTIEQAQKAAGLPFLAGPLALMADAHVGYGSTVGSVIATKGAIIPSAIGVDIGCGMIAVETSLTSLALPDSLGRLHGEIEKYVPTGMGKRHSVREDVSVFQKHWPSTHSATARLTSDSKLVETAYEQFGTLGGGNHFIELCLDENDHLWVVLHSGSRGVGNKLANMHIDGAKDLMARYFIKLPDPDLAYLVEGTGEFYEYIADMAWAQEYAMGNREAMMDAVLTVLSDWLCIEWGTENGILRDRINCHHNYTEMEHHHGKDVWLTRKGAVRARVGDRGVIPGSMATGSYIVSGLGNPASYNSCSHGAGRVLSRTAARNTLSVEDMRASMEGKAWNDRDAENLIDEAPAAYKDLDTVMADQADLVTIDHKLTTILNVKGVEAPRRKKRS